MKRLLISFIIFLFITGGVVLVSAYIYYSRDLPNLKYITNYKPTLINEIYSADGKLVARFGLQKRILVEPEDIPEHVKDAFIAVEDKRFFEHKGIDPIGIMRALFENIRRGSIVEGGSTITQQVAKNLILSPERTFSRKIKEAILAYRIERNLTKEEILYLYLNHIYLADGTYGVEAASRNYFGKGVKELNLAEAALLAGIPKRPEYYSPRKHLERAIKRQRVILSIMRDNGFISDTEYKEAISYKIRIIPKNDLYSQVAPYFVEFVRQYLKKKVGKDNYERGGYKIFTTLDTDISLAAHWAIRRGIYEYERRRGRRFVLKRIRSKKTRDDFLHLQEKNSFSKGSIVKALVVSVKSVKGNIQLATVQIGDRTGSFKFIHSYPFGKSSSGSDLNFPLSEKYLPLNGYNGVYVVPENLVPGDVIYVKILDMYKERINVYPVFVHSAQAAFVAIDNRGNIVAMVGGVNFSESQFNRAIQAKRQPGSSFKPFVYSAALDKGYTETSILFDIPVMLGDWEPKNYDNNYDGAILLREAIARSRNLATIRMAIDISPQYIVDYVQQFGFKSMLRPYPSIALGGFEVSLFEMAKAYTVFMNEGKLVEPRFILRIYDRNGAIIEDNTDPGFIKAEQTLNKSREERIKRILEAIAKKKRRQGSEDKEDDENIVEESYVDIKTKSIYGDSSFLSPAEFLELLREHKLEFDLSKDSKPVITEETAYIVTDLLRAVIMEGTAKRAKSLNRLAPIAGKTGTTNDYTDAWFVGYSPKITAGVWVGKDDSSSLGKKETGARAALPIWMYFMEDVLSTKYPNSTFRIPSGIKIVQTPYGEIPYRESYLVSGKAADNLEIRIEDSGPKDIDSVLREIRQKKQLEEQKRFDEEAEIDFLLRR